MTRDPDILLRILLGAIEQQEDHDRILEILDELSQAIAATDLVPQRVTLMTACRELLNLNEKPATE